jgi:hypothetical protein
MTMTGKNGNFFTVISIHFPSIKIQEQSTKWMEKREKSVSIFTFKSSRVQRAPHNIFNMNKSHEKKINVLF